MPGKKKSAKRIRSVKPEQHTKVLLKRGKQTAEAHIVELEAQLEDEQTLSAALQHHIGDLEEQARAAQQQAAEARQRAREAEAAAAQVTRQLQAAQAELQQHQRTERDHAAMQQLRALLPKGMSIASVCRLFATHPVGRTCLTKLAHNQWGRKHAGRPCTAAHVDCTNNSHIFRATQVGFALFRTIPHCQRMPCMQHLHEWVLCAPVNCTTHIPCQPSPCTGYQRNQALCLQTSFLSRTVPLLQGGSGGKTSKYLVDAIQRRQISMVEGGWSYRADAKVVRAIIMRRCEVSDPYNTESDSSARQHDKETHHAYLRRDAGAYIYAGVC